MTADPLLRRALELLAGGHRLYAGDRISSSAIAMPDQLPDHADRLAGVTSASGLGASAARSRQLQADLRRAASADTELMRLVNAGYADRAVGRDQTGTVLHDAHADRMPAADTAIGRREAARRMLSRLRAQHRYVRNSSRQSRLLAHRMRQLAYRGRGHAEHVIPLDALRYHRPAGASAHSRQLIAAALDRLGVRESLARGNWIRGYQTLIARESGGRPAAVASVPAGAAGPNQPDGYGLGYARGLTQTIPATFARYHQPGTSIDIYDPVANICASMNYVMRRYGVGPDASNLVALVQQADPHRPPRGY